MITGTVDKYGEVDTWLGKLWVAYSARGIKMISVRKEGPAGFEKAYLQRFRRKPSRSKVPDRFVRAVRQAVQGKTLDAVPVDLSGLQAFDQEVLLLLPRIPRGEVRSYGWVAREAGRPRAVRAVGNAMARNPVPFLLPCHRVVSISGGIGNYALGSRLKRDLLKREGVPVAELDALARKGVRYLGSRSMRIYCFPSCGRARRLRPRDRLAFKNIGEAVEAGCRPCTHCRPDAPPSP